MLPVMAARTSSARGMRVVIEQRLGAHQLAGGAEAALRAVVFDEGFLQRMQLVVVRQAFDGLDGAAVGPDRELAAGVDRLAVQQHGAGAAFAAVAADLGAGEPQVIAQQFDQGPAIFDFDAMLDAVDGQFDGGVGDGGCGCRLLRGQRYARGNDQPSPGGFDEFSTRDLAHENLRDENRSTSSAIHFSIAAVVLEVHRPLAACPAWAFG